MKKKEVIIFAKLHIYIKINNKMNTELVFMYKLCVYVNTVTLLQNFACHLVEDNQLKSVVCQSLCLCPRYINIHKAHNI